MAGKIIIRTTDPPLLLHLLSLVLPHLDNSRICSPLSLAQILIIGETSPIPGVNGVDKFSYSTLWELFEKDLNKPSE